MTAGGETATSESVAVVVTAVRDGIMRGRYAPGQRLPESDLVSLYSASRGGVGKGSAP
jgi:DNA-binding GntR family transcriptional regulator